MIGEGLQNDAFDPFIDALKVNISGVVPPTSGNIGSQNTVFRFWERRVLIFWIAHEA